MNREIKFRVWDKREEKGSSTKEMLYDTQKHHLWYDTLDYPEVYAVMQFTGLKDKKGKEIYEGDIVKSLKYNPVTETREESFDVVCWRYCGFVTLHVKNYNQEWCGGSEIHDTNELTVVGNIFENSEMIAETAQPR